MEKLETQNSQKGLKNKEKNYRAQTEQIQNLYEAAQ